MSRADEVFKRQMSCGPAGTYKMSEQIATVRSVAQKKKSISVVGGEIMINDGSGWRLATEDEIAEMGG